MVAFASEEQGVMTLCNHTFYIWLIEKLSLTLTPFPTDPYGTNANKSFCIG